MQTFLPYYNYRDCASCLDKIRLWKQCLEAKQIINTINKIIDGQSNVPWSNHPAIYMWEPWFDSLKNYYNCILQECLNRKIKTNFQLYDIKVLEHPVWLGNSKLHFSHQANLIRKDKEYYSIFFPNIKPMNGYYWPMKKIDGKLYNIGWYKIND